MQAKAMEKARANGADAVLFSPVSTYVSSAHRGMKFHEIVLKGQLLKFKD